MFRNILLEYIDVDLREVHEVLTRHLDDFVEFVGLVKGYLARQG